MASFLESMGRYKSLKTLIYEAIQCSDLTETHYKVGFQLVEVENNNKLREQEIIIFLEYVGIQNKHVKPVLPTFESTGQEGVSTFYK